MSFPFRRVCSTVATGEGLTFKSADNDVHSAPGEQHATTTATTAPVAAPEEEDGSEVFSQARDTLVTVSESDNDDDGTLQDGSAAPGNMRTTRNITPAGSQPTDDVDTAHRLPSSGCALPEGSGSSLRAGRGNEGKEEEEEEQEEWCTGHVCLRLRPDGLRERRRGSPSGVGVGLRDDAEEGSGDESGSDAEFASGSDGEVRLLANA